MNFPMRVREFRQTCVSNDEAREKTLRGFSILQDLRSRVNVRMNPKPSLAGILDDLCTQRVIDR